MNSFADKLKDLLTCDIKDYFELARSLNRKIYFFVGPTNSGKTFEALKHLKKADCGVYLAPLRLLALEVYEELNNCGVKTNLITGEEEIIDENATHISSTIEMLNFELETDVCVIDEIQMIEDRDRGHAWVNALIGAPAKKIILTGSVNALNAVKKIASFLDEELEIVKFQRKNPLHIIEKPISLKNIPKKSALITFSRNDVLKLKSKLKKYKTSIIYGNLSPEVRREEARKFREGLTEVLIATDAIALGLNLPIETIIFTTDTKFDGKEKRKLTSNEIVQIAGRAGRYNLHDIGYIGATKKSILNYIHKMMHSPIKTIKPPFPIKATLNQIQNLSILLNTKSLFKILQYYSKNMKFFGPFVAANIKDLLINAKLLDSYPLNLEDKYILASAPINHNSITLKSAYKVYIKAVLNKKKLKYKLSIDLSKKIKTDLDLLKAEDEVKKISLYLWLSYKYPEIFIDFEEVKRLRYQVNQYCEKGLSSNLKEKKLKFGGRKRWI